MTGCSATVVVLLGVFACAASAPTSITRTLDTLVTAVTTGLELPTELIDGFGDGTGSIQVVVNVHTDSQGNIQSEKRNLDLWVGKVKGKDFAAEHLIAPLREAEIQRSGNRWYIMPRTRPSAMKSTIKKKKEKIKN